MNQINVLRQALDRLAPVARVSVIVATILMAVTLFAVARLSTAPEFQEALQKYNERCAVAPAYSERGVLIPAPIPEGC